MMLRLVIAWVVTQPVSRLSRRVTYAALLACLLAPPLVASADESDAAGMHLITDTHGPELKLNTETGIWQDGVGNGFKSGSHSLSFEVGSGPGLKILGSQERHALFLTSVSYGYMLGSVMGDGHWYKGNLELRGELWGGVQYSPDNEWVIGLTPHLRYNFATGTRFVPYFDIGAGVTATSIHEPDLSQTFEFNLQAAGGVHWFIKDNVALGLEVRFMHMSDAGTTDPNYGANNISGLLGVSWFF